MSLKKQNQTINGMDDMNKMTKTFSIKIKDLKILTVMILAMSVLKVCGVAYFKDLSWWFIALPVWIIPAAILIWLSSVIIWSFISSLFIKKENSDDNEIG